MAFRESLELLLNANADGGIAEVRKFASEAVKSTETAESSFKKLGSTALKLGGAGMAAGGFLTAMADADKQSLEGLKATIETTGHSYAEYEDRVDSLIAAQVKFGHTDGEVTQALSTLTSSFGDADKAADQMQLVADLAAKKHISLADAAGLVAKAHGGAGRVFKEFNIQVGENADGTKNYDGALSELSGKLQGQASASVSGFTGQLKVLGAQAENFVSNLGEKFGPAILGVSTGLTAFGGVASGVGKGLDYLKARHAAAADAAEGQSGKTGKLGKVMGGLGLAAVAVGLYEVGKSMNDNALLADNFADKITKLNQQQLLPVARGFAAFSQATGGLADQAREGLQKLADSGPAGIGVITQMRDAVAATGGDTKIFDDILQHAAESQKNLAANTDVGTKSVEDQAAADKKAKDALKALNDEQQKDLDLATARMGGIIGLSNAQISARESIAELKKATDDHTLSEDQHQKALNEAESSILAEAAAAGQLAQKQAEATGSTDAAKAATHAQITELYGVLQTLQPGSPLFNAVVGYIATLNSTPGEISTDFVLSASASASTRSLLESFGRLSATHSAGGQRNFRGGLSVVGEEGPELVYVPTGSDVYTASDTRRMFSGSGGSSGSVAGASAGGTSAVSSTPVNIYVMKDQWIVDALVRTCKSNGALPKVVTGVS